jgi:pimeloyl-ACP methyl ester carboxylesterase
MRKYGAGCGGAVGKLLGGTPQEMPLRYQQTSPAELLPSRVPQRLIHGELDKIVPVALGRDYEATARARRIDARLTVLPNAGHFELVSPQSAAWPAVEDAVRSLLKLKKPKKTERRD